MIRKLEYLIYLIIVFVIFNADLKRSIAAECGDVMASYRGVDAKHNGIHHGTGEDCAGSGDYGLEFQCVEYINRFYVEVLNYPNMKWGGNARDYYINASNNTGKQADLTAYPNGESIAPKIGDILGFDDGEYGHVSIITGVGINFDSIRLIEQNSSSTGIKLLDMSKNAGNYTIQDRVSYETQGWIRKVCAFGTANSSVRWHPDGTLVRATTKVYLIHDGKKKHVTDGSLLSEYHYGFDWNNIIEVSQEEIDCFVSDEDINIPPRLVRASGQDDVYLIFNGRYKKRFDSPEVFEGLGYAWEDIDSELSNYPDDPVSPVLYSPYPDGTLVKEFNYGTVYVISNGKKRAIASETVFNKLGYNWDCIIEGPTELIDNIPDITPAIDENMITECPGEQTLFVSLTAPSDGDAPLSVNFTADIWGTATGTINYTFWWNCDNPDTSVSNVMGDCGSIPTPSSGYCTSNENGYKCDGVWNDPKTVNHTYSNPGVYVAKVIAERGSAVPVEDRIIITVSTMPADLNNDRTINIADVQLGINSFFAMNPPFDTDPLPSWAWDANSDGQINSDDISAMTDFIYNQADVNKSGMINTTDVTLIIDGFLGI